MVVNVIYFLFLKSFKTITDDQAWPKVAVEKWAGKTKAKSTWTWK